MNHRSWIRLHRRCVGFSVWHVRTEQQNQRASTVLVFSLIKFRLESCVYQYNWRTMHFYAVPVETVSFKQHIAQISFMLWFTIKIRLGLLWNNCHLQNHPPFGVSFPTFFHPQHSSETQTKKKISTCTRLWVGCFVCVTLAHTLSIQSWEISSYIKSRNVWPAVHLTPIHKFSVELNKYGRAGTFCKTVLIFYSWVQRAL